MSIKYYSQWSDLKEFDNDYSTHDDDEIDDEDTPSPDEDEEQESGCCASGCMICSGMSNSDFF